MKDVIKQAYGNEVFFAGKINAEGIVVSIEVGSRGSSNTVPVQFELARKYDVLIHNHPSGNLTPSNADLSVASHAAECAQGFYIVDNDVTSVYVVVEPIKPTVIKKLDSEELCLFLSSEGPLAEQNDKYEERPSQLELLRRVCSSFNNNEIGVFEAGTGVGKSYAYLIPSIYWALLNKERVVISTGTINLQQQLAEKDIPAALNLIGKPLKYILMKGRQNYVCLRRLNDQITEPDLFAEEDEELTKLVEWSKVSKTGSRSELTFVPSEFLWRNVCSESDACMGMRCKYHENCFVMKVRKEAADAQILVVNHHLLFSDIEARLEGAGFEDTAVLPPYKRIIFDEAHGIESAATSFFSEDLTKFKILKQIRVLYRNRRNGAVAGHIFTLTALSIADDNSDEIIAAIERIKDTLQQLDEASLALLDMQTTFRICVQTAHMFEGIKAKFENLGNALSDFIGLVRELIDTISEDNRENQAVWETKTILRRLDFMAVLCRNFTVWDEHQDNVFFIEKVRINAPVSASGPRFYCRFVQSPLDISYKMNEGIFEPMDSVTCVSATLRIGNNFNFWLNRSGASLVEPERLKTALFTSPFPYNKNMLFAVPSDVPLPENSSFQSFVEDAVVNLILSACGRTLVLFTSYESLRSATETARVRLTNTGISVLQQGDDDRFRLLDTFKKDAQSVLFATDSFWEGVDVPGESLSQVIIVKLPFSVPNDPIFAARAEAIESRGRSSFMDLSIPEAVIKFRQGVGRLIRHSNDRGCVIVLDRRIYEKRYGKIFLDSIPECKQMYEPINTICNSVERFLF